MHVSGLYVGTLRDEPRRTGWNLGLYSILAKEQCTFRELAKQRKRILSFQSGKL